MHWQLSRNARVVDQNRTVSERHDISYLMSYGYSRERQGTIRPAPHRGSKSMEWPQLDTERVFDRI